MRGTDRARIVSWGLAILAFVAVAVGSAASSVDASGTTPWRVAGGWTIGLVLPVAAFVWLTPRRGEPVPERWAVVVLYCLVMAPTIALWRWCPDDPDLAYYVGMVREIRAGFPPDNPELSGTLLAQPIGYWAYYASIHGLTGVPVPIVIRTVGVLVGALLLLAVHRLAWRMWSDRGTAFAATALLLVPGHLSWLVHLVRTGSVFGYETVWHPFARTLAIAWYNGPALVLLVVAATRAAELVTSGGKRRDSLLLAAILAALPFLHPVYTAYAYLAVLPTVGYLLLRVRPMPRWPLVVLGSPLPFVLYQGAIGGALLGRGLPWELLSAGEAAAELGRIAEHHGVLVALAVVGVASTIRGREARVLPVAALAALAILLDVLTRNEAGNRHWDYDPLTLALAPLAGRGVVVALRAPIPWRIAAVTWLVPAVVLGVGTGPWTWTVEGIVRGEPRRCEDPVGYAGAAAWLRARTPPDAVVLTAPDSLAASWTEMEGRRRLVFGHGMHLQIQYPEHVWQPVRSDVERVLHARTPERVSAFTRRHGASHLLVGCPERADGCEPLPIEGILECPYRRERVSICRLPGARSDP